MSGIEAAERKAIGADLAKDFSPLVGKTGMEFEREALLMVYNTLNEQRHPGVDRNGQALTFSAADKRMRLRRPF
jgi:hypothetical protein